MSKRRSSTVIENPDKRIRSDAEAEEEEDDKEEEEEEDIADHRDHHRDVPQRVGGRLLASDHHACCEVIFQYRQLDQHSK